MHYKFETLVDEKETIILIDHLTLELNIYTSNQVIANRIAKRLGKPQHIDEFGCEWIIKLADFTKLNCFMFITKKQER